MPRIPERPSLLRPRFLRLTQPCFLRSGKALAQFRNARLHPCRAPSRTPDFHAAGTTGRHACEMPSPWIRRVLPVRIRSIDKVSRLFHDTLPPDGAIGRPGSPSLPRKDRKTCRRSIPGMKCRDPPHHFRFSAPIQYLCPPARKNTHGKRHGTAAVVRPRPSRAKACHLAPVYISIMILTTSGLSSAASAKASTALSKGYVLLIRRLTSILPEAMRLMARG